MTTKRRSIKVSESAHRQLKLLAVRTGEHVYQVVDRLLEGAPKEITTGGRGDMQITVLVITWVFLIAKPPCGYDPIEGEDKEQVTISTPDEYDNIVTFGRVLAETLFSGTEEPVTSLLAYFEKPHKWESEYQKWRELGGTLDWECLEAFEDWHEEREMEALNQ